MRLTHAIAVLTMAGLTGLLPLQSPAAARTGTVDVAGPMDPSVDGDLTEIADAAPAPATSNAARVAPGPSERTAPAAPEVRQTPAGGEKVPKPCEAKKGKCHD